MNERDFVYWLQGFFEIAETNKLSEKQVLIIKEHLNLVFTKVTKVDISDKILKEAAEEMSKKEIEKAKEKGRRDFDKFLKGPTYFDRHTKIC